MQSSLMHRLSINVPRVARNRTVMARSLPPCEVELGWRGGNVIVDGFPVVAHGGGGARAGAAVTLARPPLPRAPPPAATRVRSAPRVAYFQRLQARRRAWFGGGVARAHTRTRARACAGGGGCTRAAAAAARDAAGVARHRLRGVRGGRARGRGARAARRHLVAHVPGRVGRLAARGRGVGGRAVPGASAGVAGMAYGGGPRAHVRSRTHTHMRICISWMGCPSNACAWRRYDGAALALRVTLGGSTHVVCGVPGDHTPAGALEFAIAVGPGVRVRLEA